MKPTLQFRLSQHLTLTPQLQQSIRLLQLSTVELDQEIERHLMENPILEREDGTDADAPPAFGAGSGSSSAPEAAEPAPETHEDWSGSTPSRDDDGDRTFSAPDSPTLRAHLYEQLSVLNLVERDRALIGALIDALDENGWLTQSIEEIAAMAAPEEQVSVEEISIALRHLQHFDPSGVGARSLSECLALQIRDLRTDGGADDAVCSLATKIVEQHLELLRTRDYVRLKTATGANEEALRAAQRLIKSLNPHPGSSFATIETRYVTPDVIVRKSKGAWRASLNPAAVPRLRINRLYAELAAGSRGSGSALTSQLQEAKWLIKNVQQRFETILNVSQAIVDRQRHFFEHGEVAMRPLVLREIADTLGLHESTISRVTNQKYMATPRGTFEFKYFFGSHVGTDTGGAASATAIRAVIKRLIAEEDPRAPYSDARISQILFEQGGFVVARRTIAKYREALQIPPVTQRKSL